MEKEILEVLHDLRVENLELKRENKIRINEIIQNEKDKTHTQFKIDQIINERNGYKNAVYLMGFLWIVSTGIMMILKR